MTGKFPADERFGLTAQLRRAAVSIPSNIAEGQGRRSGGAFRQHVSIARGSLLEVETQTLISVRLGFAKSTEAEAVLSQCSDLSRMLHGLARAVDETPDARRPTPDDTR